MLSNNEFVLVPVKQTFVCLPPGSSCSSPGVPGAVAVKKLGQEIKVKERFDAASFLTGDSQPSGSEGMRNGLTIQNVNAKYIYILAMATLARSGKIIQKRRKNLLKKDK
jgi:hypothetical protein